VRFKQHTLTQLSARRKPKWESLHVLWLNLPSRDPRDLLKQIWGISRKFYLKKPLRLSQIPSLLLYHSSEIVSFIGVHPFSANEFRARVNTVHLAGHHREKTEFPASEGYFPSLTSAPFFCLVALSIATPFDSIYLGLHNYNCALACIAIGGMFYALTWQTHLLALACGMYLTW